MKILVEEIVLFCGVPEALLSDRGANLLSHLMRNVRELLGMKKLKELLQTSPVLCYPDFALAWSREQPDDQLRTQSDHSSRARGTVASLN